MARESVVIEVIIIEFLGTYLSLLKSLESRPVFKVPFVNMYYYLCCCCMQTLFYASIDVQEVPLKTCENYPIFWPKTPSKSLNVG